MSGPTFEFVAFGLAVALLAALSRSHAWRQGVQLVASLAFLATFTHDIAGVWPLGGFLLAGWLAVAVTARRAGLRGPAIVVLLVLFVWLKRYAFVPAATWISGAYITVGLSYVLFRLLHLVIEAGADPAFRRPTWREFAVYLIGFNTLVAGPIAFFDEVAPERGGADAVVTLSDVGVGAERIVVGLFKTNVLAAALVALRATALAELRTPASVGGQVVAASAAFALYPFFLYCYFSGYIDIVLGLSRMMGQRLPENFDRPFAAASFIDFWNRWHITLSRWLRRYVYNPLLVTLMRRFPARRLEPVWAVVAFFVTFFLVGAWHGQTTAFLFFGVLQGAGVSANKMYQLAMGRRLGRRAYATLAAHPLYRAVARGLTFTWFCFTLAWFWGSWREVGVVWSSASSRRWAVAWVALLVVSTVALAAWEALRARVLVATWGGRLDPLRARTAWTTTLLVVVVIAVLVATTSAPEIVYKDF